MLARDIRFVFVVTMAKHPGTSASCMHAADLPKPSSAYLEHN